MLRCIDTKWFSKPRIAVGLVAGLALLGACGDDDTAASPPTAADLDGRTFVATEIEGHDIVEGSEIMITFDAGAVVVQAGCNTQRTDYTVDDTGVLEANAAMVSTMMACDDALMAQDQLVADIVTAGPTLSLDGDTLTIDGGDDAVITLVETS